MKSLVAYLLKAALVWQPTSNAADIQRYTSIAEDVAFVAEDTAEPALLRDDETRVKTGLLVMSVARYESRFAQNVDEGKCKSWECDGGHAFTLWQIHPAQGLKFDGELWQYSFDPERLTGAKLIADRRTAARMAMHMMRQSLRRTGNLCIYTGESCEVGKHPKATIRMSSAVTYLKENPYTPDAPESASL